jgi:transketolase
VVSMPCEEWFDEQEASYRDSVIPPSVKARVSVEAGVSMGWRDVIGDAGRHVGIEHYGASADFKTLFREFGITAEAVVQAAEDSMAAARELGGTLPSVPRRAHGPVGPADEPVTGEGAGATNER